MRNYRVRISQCMIVKNEEENIRRALSWGKDVLWEQIVVDTGSTDQTVKRAKDMGASVYHIPWQDDFALAKNAAISRASGDWIAFLDADETMALDDVQKLLPLLERLKDAPVDGISTGWMQMDETGRVTVAGTQVRIFRNRPGLGYRRRIHEQLCLQDGKALRLWDAPELSILHDGYCGKAWERKRGSDRNLKLIQMELLNQPGDHEMLGYLGDEYYGREDFEQAEECYRKAWNHMPSVLDNRDQRSAATLLHLFQIAAARGDTEEALLHLHRSATGLLPEEGDFDYLLGRHYACLEQFERGAFYLEQALGKLDRYGCTNKSMLLMGNLSEVYENIALCFVLTDNFKKAVGFSAAVLKSNPYSMSALHTLIKAFKGQVKWEEAAEFLKKLYVFSRLKDRLFVLRVAGEAGWKDLEEYMESLFTKEERIQLTRGDEKENHYEG